MVKKTQNKLDNDFDFSAEFGGDDFDFDLPDPTVKDDRKPSIKIASGFKEGMKETLMSRDFAISSAKKLFPTGYGQAYDEADRIGQTFKNLYDESAQAIKPAIKQAKQIATRLVPSDSKYLPAGLAKVFKGWEQEAKDESGSPGNVEGNNREALLSASLKDLFKAEAMETHKTRVQDKAEGDLERGVASIRHKSILETLNRTALATTSLDNYNTRINVNYQKQSLTLQYRQLFALEDIRADFARDSLKRDSILLAVAKNTALPEYAKIRDSEARKQAIKNRFYDSIASGLYGARNQYVEKTLAGLKKNVGTAVRNTAHGFMSGLTQASMMIDMADGSGLDPAVMAGNLAGSGVTEGFGHALAARAGRALTGSKLDKKWGITDKAHKLSAGVDSMPNWLNEFRKSSKYAWGDSLKDKGLSLLQSLLPGMAPDTQTDIARGGDMNSPFHFTRRTDRSINEVIPGFLSRILREMQILRSGNNKVPLIEYDHDTNGFARGDTVAKGILTKSVPAGAVQATQMRLNGIMAMIDPNGAMTPETRAAVRKRLLFNSADNNLASRERLADESAYSGHSAAVTQEATSHMTDFFNHAGEEKIKDFKIAHNQLSRDIADPRQHIQQQIDLGHLQRLSRMGLVNARTGQIDLAKILTMYLDERNGIEQREAPMPGLTENLNDGPQGAFVGPRKGTLRNARDSLRQAFEDREELTRKGKRGAKRAAIKGRRLSRDAALFVKDQATDLKDQAISAAGAIRDDLYAATEDHPRLRAALVESEQYIQKSTGKIVKTFADLTDDIVDRKTNAVVITKAELSTMGVIDEKTGKLKPISDLSSAIGKAIKQTRITKDTFSKEGVKKLATEMAQTFKTELIGDVDVPTGVKVEGEETERITMAEMKEGSCTDVDTGLPVLKPSDITGAVKNKLGQVVIRMEDLPKLRFFNVRIAKYSPLWFAGKLITKALRWQLVGAPQMAARNLRRLGKFALGAASMAAKSVMWLAGIRPGRQAEDLYLPGEPNPIIIGRTMANGGYWSVRGGKLYKQVLRPMDIDGELRDENGQVVITYEQYKQGLYNIHGRKVTKSLLGKIIKAALALPFKVAGKVVSLPAKAAWQAAKLAAQGSGMMLKGLGRGAAAAAGGLARSAGWLAGIRYEGTPEERAALYEQRKNSSGARVELKDPVDKKIPGVNLDKLEAKDSGKFTEIQRKTGMGREEAERVHELKDMDVLAAEAKTEMAERKSKTHRAGSYEDRLEQAKNKLKGLATKEGIKGLAQQIKDKASKAKEGWNMRDVIDGAEDAKDAAKGAWKGAKKGGSWLARNARRLWNMRKGVGGLAAAAEGAGALAGVGGTAAAGATALEAGAVAATAAEGTAAVVGGGSLLAGLGAGIAGVLGSPILIGALAAGLIGYGLYKGFKYLRKGHLSELGQLRCVQYGFAADDTSHARAILNFETLMTPLVKAGPSGQLVIDEQKIQLKECLKVFDLEPGNPLHVKSFLAWYKNRFKPVFLTHESALRGLTGKTELGDADDLKPEDKKKYLDAVAFPNGPYNVVILPVADLEKSKATNAADVKKAWQVAFDALGKPNAVAKVATAVVGAATGAAAAAAAEPSKDPGKMGDYKAMASSAANDPRILTSVAATIGVNALSNGKPLDALEAVRMKAYGLIELQPDRVNALMQLEKLIEGRVKFGPMGEALVDADAAQMLGKVSNVFGVSHLVSQQAFHWYTWFQKRFLPAYLVYITAYRARTGKTTPSTGVGALRPQDQLEIARLVIGTKGIWSITDSPFDGLKLGTSDGVVKENLAFLQDQAAKAVLAEQKKTAAPAASAVSTTPPAPQTAKQQADAIRTAPSIDRQSPASSPDAEMPVKAIAGVPAVPDGGTASGLVLAAGDMSDGRNANAFVRLGRNVKLDGMNTQMKTQLMGLIEEYGNLTGKATTINDGVRTYEEQAELKRKYGARAAEPGTSMHEYGLAVDINQGTLNEMDKLGLLRKYGFVRPVGQEPWHLEPIGTQANLDLYKKDQTAAAQAVLNGAGKGGGGWGTQREAIASSRNLKLAQAILEASVSESDPKQLSGNKMAGSFAGPMSQPAISFGARTQVGSTDASSTGLPSIRTAAWHADTTQNAIIGATRTALASANDAEFQVRKPSAPLTGGPGDASTTVPDPVGPGLAGVKDTILAAAKMVGVDGNLMLQMAAVESDFNPNASPGNTSAKGLWQDTDATWADLIKNYGAKYGYTLQNTSPTDVKAAAILNAHFLKDNLAALAQKSGQAPGSADAYAMHLLGKSGGAKFLQALAQNPDASAAALFPKAAQDNSRLFYSGGQALSLKDVYANLTEVIRRKSQAYGLNMAASSTHTAGALIGVQPSAQPRAQILPISTRGRPSSMAPAVIGAGTAPMMQPPSSFLPPAYSAAQQTTQPQHILDSKVFSKSEDLLGQQLVVQTSMRDLLIEIKTMIGNKADGSATPPETDTSKAQTYTPPRGRVDMSRRRFG